MAKKKNQPAPLPEANPDFEAKLDRIGKAHGLTGNSQDQAEESGITKKIIIKKAKIDDPFLNVTYHESVILISGTKRKDIGGTISREGENAVHDDLRNAFAKLNPHLALIAEMIQGEITLDDIDAKSYEDFKVTGFSIGGSGDHEGVLMVACPPYT